MNSIFEVKREPMDSHNEDGSSISSNNGPANSHESINWANIEQYSIIKFLTKEGSTPMEIYPRLQTIFQEKTLPEVQVYYTAGRFAEGRESIIMLEDFKLVETAYEPSPTASYTNVSIESNEAQKQEEEIQIPNFNTNREVDFTLMQTAGNEDMSSVVSSLFENPSYSTSSYALTKQLGGRQLHWSWKYFDRKVDIINDKPTIASFCKFCNERYVNNATRMAMHLLKKCKKMPKDLASALRSRYSDSYVYNKKWTAPEKRHGIQPIPKIKLNIANLNIPQLNVE